MSLYRSGCRYIEVQVVTRIECVTRGEYHDANKYDIYKQVFPCYTCMNSSRNHDNQDCRFPPKSYVSCLKKCKKKSNWCVVLCRWRRLPLSTLRAHTCCWHKYEVSRSCAHNNHFICCDFVAHEVLVMGTKFLCVFFFAFVTKRFKCCEMAHASSKTNTHAIIGLPDSSRVRIYEATWLRNLL